MNEFNINMPEFPLSQTVYSTEMSIRYRENYIHPTAVIGPNVKMGTGNYIGPFCIIGYPAEHKEFWGKPVGQVVIGDNNVFTGHVTIDAGTEKPTTIGNGCWFLKHSHAGHDAFIANEVTISCGAKIGGHCIIGFQANIGLNACIHQRCYVWEYCMVGMGAVVTKKTPFGPNLKLVGVPARVLGPNIKDGKS